jgi:uncharacterized protein YndB with AHSA1/START domain
MPQFGDSIEIGQPPERVWELLAQPERWVEGYVETRSRSAGYPAPDTRNDHVYRTRMREDVSVRVLRSDAPTALVEEQEGKTFTRRVRYTLTPADGGTTLRVEDDVNFKGLGKLAAPIAARDVKRRWTTSLRKLRDEAQAEK